ncbi:hypothetical protein [Marinobacter halophilus]|uniref:Uncharacterized protein n=1 Tax=Marinobacter halophilus TaxID=1323740 RepID=A0A2T1K8R5_9GAMM|nr:hypothetical protein [Marinobacter halophilus]PSF06524.1 hypothetical protein C7H08_15605 [Marinobacter halophilus]GGC73353.1 hypothetical protein GCM10011362_22350 [Marinobacter halophilus]
MASLAQLNDLKAEQPSAMPDSFRSWLALERGVYHGAGGGEVEWSEAELYVALPRPCGKAWCSA